MRKNILVKRAEAKERQSLRNKLTPEQQLARLDKKLGVDIGAASESYISVVNNQAKDIDALRLEIKGIKDQLLQLEEDTRDASRLLNEVVSRIVTAGCNLTGTILNHAREE